jgi:UDP-galactopyranose mutase
VIDERMDYPLLAGVASARPAWQIVLIGPTAKVDPASLPKAPNIHYLGPKAYAALPSYIAGWDVAMLPFARNDATRFISPTKTPEYLAAGKPVVSTSIRDVVRPYGQRGLARIADSVGEVLAAVTAALAEDPAERLRAADAFLTHTSWDGTWMRMRLKIEEIVTERLRRDGPRAVSAS